MCWGILGPHTSPFCADFAYGVRLTARNAKIVPQFLSLHVQIMTDAERRVTFGVVSSFVAVLLPPLESDCFEYASLKATRKRGGMAVLVTKSGARYSACCILWRLITNISGVFGWG